MVTLAKPRFRSKSGRTLGYELKYSLPFVSFRQTWPSPTVDDYGYDLCGEDPLGITFNLQMKAKMAFIRVSLHIC